MKKLQTVNDLREYMAGVDLRISSRGQLRLERLNVDQIWVPILGTILRNSTGPIYVHEAQGEAKNALWFYVGKHRYSVTYSHGAHAIEVRDWTWNGQILATFTNDTPLTKINAFFGNLGQKAEAA